MRKYEGATHFKLDDDKPVIVLDESISGRNEIFYDIAQKKALSRSEFILAIRQGHYLGYFVKEIDGLETPVSKSDGKDMNNLG